jgi:hypothetical protein
MPAHGDLVPARLREDNYSMRASCRWEDLERRHYDVHCEVHVQISRRPRFAQIR